MRLTALVSYFREDPVWLARAVGSLASLGVTNLVACDGAYEAFPDATARGSDEERDVIYMAGEQAGIVTEVFRPSKLWKTEMEKRSFMFEWSEGLGSDWHLVFDADYLVAEGFDLKPTLEDFDADVGEILLRHHVLHGSALTNVMMPMPMLFRALPGLKVVGHHANYETHDKRLWGSEDAESRIRIEGVVVDHLSAFREPERLEQAQTYYQRRHELGLERHPAPIPT